MDTNIESREPACEQGPVHRAWAIDLAGQWRESASNASPERAAVLQECAEALEREVGVLRRVVGIYLVDRAYGGPEEGGWYYDVGELYPGFEPIACCNNEEARAACVKCEAFIAEHRMNEGRHEPNSVLCDGWYAGWAFRGTTAPDHFPEAIPRYE